MNQWVKKSIELANDPGYLDKLHAVYPMEVSGFREIEKDTQERIKEALKEKNGKKLINIILNELELFPIKDSYVAFLKRGSEALDNNPKTVKRIADRLIAMGFDEIIKSSTQPKETNRQIGPLFRRWVATLGYPILSQDKFVNYKGIAILEGTDKSLRKFAKDILGLRLKKGIDLIMKKGDVYIVGESKFLTDFGGHQNAQFSDPLGLLRSRKGPILRIAILDGVIWLKTKNKMHLSVKRGDKLAFSTLLLKEFIESLQ